MAIKEQTNANQESSSLLRLLFKSLRHVRSLIAEVYCNAPALWVVVCRRRTKLQGAAGHPQQAGCMAEAALHVMGVPNNVKLACKRAMEAG
jgi:hypothetical protein